MPTRCSAFSVVRMNELTLPMQTARTAFRNSGVGTHLSIQIVAFSIRQASPNQLGQCLGKRAKPLFTLPQLCLCRSSGSLFLVELVRTKSKCLADQLKLADTVYRHLRP